MILDNFSTAALDLHAEPSKSGSQFLKKILVPTDFSEHADNAIRFALALALRSGADMHLLHTVNIPVRTTDMLVNPIAEMEKAALDKLGEIEEELREWLNSKGLSAHNISFQVRTGFTGELIADIAEDWGADLIVMGTQGAGKLEGMLIGSNTTDVIGRAKCTVLAVPEEARFTGIRTIVYATDMQEEAPEAYEDLLGYARLFDATVDFLHIITPKSRFSPARAEAFQESVTQHVNYDKILFSIFETDSNKVTGALQDYIDDGHADMVAMLTHHRSFFEKLFHPSITRRMCLHTDTPLLAFHA